ncbi:hypothetical protein AB1Y20_002005 [Prymnesium parvum]|uniref:LisH domain-containing protein n=1 Tax=Prymnesium parvum TaxID=97485 RepID=A0AB34J9R7_PRYPA
MAGKLAPSGEAELSALSKQLKGTLEAHGQLHAIRAQLRACVHAALAGTPPPPPRAAGSADGRLALGLVAEFLRWHGLQHSLATLACELGDWDERAPSEELCDALRLPAGRPLLVEMVRARREPEPLAHVSPPPLREPRGALSPTSPTKDNAPPPSPPATAAPSSPPSSGCRNAAAASVKGAAEKRGVGPLKQAACAESEEEWVRVEMARRQAEAEAKAEAAARAETEARREAEARARAAAEAEAEAKAEAARRAREVAEVLAKAEAAKEEEDARLLESHRSIWSGSSALPKMPSERRGGGSGLDAFMMKETEKERQQQQLREAQVKVEQNESEAKEMKAREKEEREKEEREKEAKEREAKEREAKEKEAKEKAAKEKAEAEAAAAQKAQGSDSDRSERDLLLELEAATDSDEGDTFGEKKPKPAAPREGAATRVATKAKVFVVEGESDVSEDELWGGGSAKHLTSRKPAAKKQAPASRGERAPAERPAPRIQWEQPEAAPSPAAAPPPPPAAAPPPPPAAAPPPPPAAAAPAKPPPPAADDSAEEVSDIEEDLVFDAVGSDSGSDDAW